MTIDRLTEQIKQYAYDLGFSKVGVARAERLDEESEQLRHWLDRGYHGTMSWMEPNFEKRADPRNILPDARSVIAVALNYFTPAQHNSDQSVGKISRYAWGDDYHDVLTARLETLLGYIHSIEPASEGKLYVDTGPVMDKAWAQRAGLGWKGKHTNVITQEYGSWVFLGEIILNLELEYDEPATDHCGTCTLCIEACPTQAIVEPYVVDSNRCISYLTIEHRGEIPADLGEKFEGWIYGCDICQDVCPWNQKFSTVAPVKEFQPREQNLNPEPKAILEMNQEQFSERYRKSPIKRTKLAGLKRNARIVLSSTQ